MRSVVAGCGGCVGGGIGWREKGGREEGQIG